MMKTLWRTVILFTITVAILSAVGLSQFLELDPRLEWQVLEMSQWRHMDYIGVTGYFELTDKTAPSLEELEAAWHNDRHGQDILADLEELSNRYGKPIVFWEIGYQSKDGTNGK